MKLIHKPHGYYKGGIQAAEILPSLTGSSFENNHFILEQDETCVDLRGSLQKNAFVGDGRISSTLTEAMGTGGGQIPICIFQKKNNMDKTKRPEGKGWVYDEDAEKWFRIRRLTPREIFRLMDVKESDIDRMMSKETDKKGREVQAISNTQLYKCAGNSIVVAPMALTFENLLFPEATEQNNKQLTLF